MGAHLIGVDPQDELAIPSFRNRIVEGDFAGIGQQNAAVGIKMADDMGLRLGSRIRVTSDEGETQTFRVAALFDLGLESVNESWVYIGLPAAQVFRWVKWVKCWKTSSIAGRATA